MPGLESERVIRGFVKIPGEMSSSWLPMLKALYSFESSRVSGPGSDRVYLEGAIWSEEEAINSITLARQNQDSFKSLLKFLLEERQAMEFPRSNGPSRYLTRIAEIVRKLGHTYEYWHRGRPVIGATRWLVESKEIPERKISSTEFAEKINSTLENLIPGERGHNLRRAAREVCEAVSKSIASDIQGDWIEDVMFSEFQLKSTLKVLKSRYGDNAGSKKAQVLTAGVGSGKTIGFSIASMIEARRSMLDAEFNPELARTCLFIYPRTQLARDQAREITKFTKQMGIPGMEPWLELYETYKKKGMVTTSGVVEEYGTGANTKPIIITTYETLKRRMRRPEFMNKMADGLTTVVLDEIHLTSGVPGGMASYLLSRLKAAAESRGNVIYWIGASATIARPDVHASTLFGINREEVGVVDPSEEERVQDGINHHIFLRPNRGMSTMGALVNTTSTVLHERRDDLEKDRQDADEARPKSIGFADGLDLLSRWNDDLRENERTEEEFGKYGRKHPNTIEISNWGRKQRELPYAMRFHLPLQRRLTSKGGDDKGNEGDALVDLSGLFDRELSSSVCDRCKSGERVVLGEISPEHLKELSKLVHRHPHKEDDRFKAFWIQSEVFDSDENTKIGSHDLCPMMKAGACSWFPRPDINRASTIREPGNNYQGVYDFSSSARSTVESSKRESSNEGGEGLSSVIFKENKRNVFDLKGPGSDVRAPVDIVLSSPTLEVGVDIPMLTESVMHKAIRNIASYRQKAGRVGRDSNLDIINVSVMTQSSVDLHYYRQPRKLVSEGRLEPIALMEENRAIKACSAYGAVWEWLALNTVIPEWIEIPRGDLGRAGKDLERCRFELDSRRSEVIDYIHKATKNRLDTDSDGGKIARDALGQVLDEIELLLLSTEGTYTINSSDGGNYKVIDLFSNHRKQVFVGGVSIRLSAEVSTPLLESIDHLELEIERGIIELDAESLVSKNKRLFDLIVDVRVRKKWKSLDSEYCRLARRNILDFIGDDDELEDAAYSLIRALKKLSTAYESIESGGFDMRVMSLFEDYKRIEGPDASFLSATMEHLTLIGNQRRDSWFIRPQTLFENPYSPEVKLSIDKLGEGNPRKLTDSQKTIRLNEALHSFQPGTWTQRIPHRRLKIRTGKLIPEGEKIIAKMSEMVAANNKFQLVHEHSLPPPPGSDEEIRVWRPVELSLIESESKLLYLDRRMNMVRDDDEMGLKGGMEQSFEGEFEGKPTKDIKIPKSSANRWAWSEPDDGTPIGAFEASRFRGHSFGTESPEGERREIHADDLRHPLVDTVMDSIVWHDELEVIEYSYSNSRRYSSSGEIELSYQDKYGRSIAFGEKIITEGFSINLDSLHVDEISDSLVEDMLEGENEITPSLIKAFKAHIFTDLERGGASVNPYTLDDLISVLLIHSGWDGTGISADRLTQIVADGFSDKEGFQSFALDYYKRIMKMKRESSDEEEDRGGEGEDAMAKNRVSKLLDALGIVNESCIDFKESLRVWSHRTILSTLGSVSLSSLMRFSGSDIRDIGYLIEPSSWNGESYRVTLYDRARYGNGSCRTAKEYLHIPHVLRYSGNANRSKLPSTDFLSTLEEGLLQCMQQQSDVGSLVIHRDGGNEEGVRGIPDLVSHCKEVFDVGSDSWGEIGIKGPADAWSLPLRKRLAVYYEATIDGIYADDVERSCNICWNGCPECVDNISTTLGGLRGLDFIDKLVLDRWFMASIANSESYAVHSFDNIGRGVAEMHLGSLNNLLLTEPSGSTIHSVCLPWTMGVVTSRNDSAVPSIILRDTDVSGMRIGERAGPAMGIPSHGFRRLLWFNLLMTGHLDSVGAIKSEDKKIKLLYYDIRDISFNDLGMSPRMLDSMSAVSEVGELERLSDVLNWMLNRGFEVEICIDRQQASKEGVMSFLTSLHSSELLTIKSMPPENPGSMHKKDLITPIAFMTGSANLSVSGTSLSQETISHTMRYNKTQYESLASTARNTFRNAVDITDELDDLAPPAYRGREASSRGMRVLTPLQELVSKMSEGVFVPEKRTMEYKPNITLPSEDSGWKYTVDIVFREVASMLNTDGGFVVVGVIDPLNNPDSDDFVIGDISQEVRNNGGDDRFMVKLRTWMVNCFGQGVTSLLDASLERIGERQILVFEVKRSPVVAYHKPMSGKMKDTQVRSGYQNGGIYVRDLDSASLLPAGEVLTWNTTRFN